MRRLLSSALIAGCVLTGAVAQAKSAPKVCKLITDAKGDADDLGVTTSGGINDDALDIIGGDIATDGKLVTTVVRVVKLAKVAGTSPLGVTYYFNFSLGGVDFFTQASRITTTGDKASVGYIDTLRTSLPDSSATVVFDEKKNEVRVTFKAAQLSPQAPLKKGKKITSLEVLADRYVGAGVGVPGAPSAAVLQADQAAGTKAYVAGTPSCVVLGK